jgi:spermidine synthase
MLAPMSRRYIWVVSFTSGMCVMALEMTASRIVSPYFGTSLSVWANVIGLILVALTVGYWLGGRWADRSPKMSSLLKLLLAAAVLAALIPLLAGPISQAIIAHGSGIRGGTLIRIGSFALIAALFVAPILLLGTTSPFIIKLLVTDTRIGETSGRVFALSTIGSIIGTFGPAFWLVPTIGTRATVLLFSGILFTVVLIGLFGVRAGVLGLIPLALLPYVSHMPLRSGRYTIAETESAYQYIQVSELPNRDRLLSFDEGVMVQSRERPSSPFADGYWDWVLPLPNLSTAPQPKVLVLGFAVGSIARGMIDTRPDGGLDITGVELDPEVLELSRRFFSLNRIADRVRVEVDDARVYLERTDERFDMILLDVYANQRYIPPHVVTQEFFALARAHLLPGGFLVANVNSPRPDSPLLLAFYRTLGSAFAHVEAVHVPKSWNKLILASDGPLDWAGAQGRMNDALRAHYQPMLGWRQSADVTQGMLLTDDCAPTELLIDTQTFSASNP